MVVARDDSTHRSNQSRINEILASEQALDGDAARNVWHVKAGPVRVHAAVTPVLHRILAALAALQDSKRLGKQVHHGLGRLELFLNKKEPSSTA